MKAVAKALMLVVSLVLAGSAFAHGTIIARTTVEKAPTTDR